MSGIRRLSKAEFQEACKRSAIPAGKVIKNQADYDDWMRIVAENVKAWRKQFPPRSRVAGARVRQFVHTF